MNNCTLSYNTRKRSFDIDTTYNIRNSSIAINTIVLVAAVSALTTKTLKTLALHSTDYYTLKGTVTVRS